jgi:hypothetical protein
MIKENITARECRHNKDDRVVQSFLNQFDLTEKEVFKFLSNRSGIIKLAKNSKIKDKVVTKPLIPLIMQVEKPKENLFKRLAPNGVVEFKGMTLQASEEYDTDHGIKSLIKIDTETLEPLELYTSINSASRDIGADPSCRNLRKALYRREVHISGFYWLMVERMKVCNTCKKWTSLKDRYKSGRRNARAYSSVCKDCDNKRNNL